MKPISSMKWMECGQGTLSHPVTGNPITTEVVELKDFGRIFEVYHYGNHPEQAQRLIVAAPEMLAALAITLEALRNVPCVGETFDQHHADILRAAEIEAVAAITKTK